MKAVLDSMMWISYVTNRDGRRFQVIEKARKARVRLYVSDYILDEVVDTLRENLEESARFAKLARAAILRRAKQVILPKLIAVYVPDDPDDNAVVQTALSARAGYLVTADKVLLALGKVRSLQIIDLQTFERLIPG